MKLVTALGLGTALAMPAFAGSPAPAPMEPTVAAPAPAPMMVARNWTGFYVGGQLGYADLGRDVSGDGALGGLHAGYLHDFGNGFAAGVDGSYNWGSSIDVSAGALELGSLSQVARLGVRAGVTTGDLFFYGTVGAARARVPALGNETGPYGGIGLEYALTDNWRLGGEILYHRFNNFAGNALGADASATTAQARVSFRF
ncbi:outer membrane protein [Rhodobaculum claviforme]|nr:outer membrane beta-barrel protein [Rhodobaculum claviforme]